MNKKMSPSAQPLCDDALPKNTDGVTIRRGRVSSVDLFEIKESELDLLEYGCSETLDLNFAIFLISEATTAIVSLCTADFSRSPKIENGFLFSAILGFMLGCYLLVSWYRKHRSTKTVIQKIRERITQKSDNTSETREVDTRNNDADDNAPGRGQDE